MRNLEKKEILIIILLIGMIITGISNILLIFNYTQPYSQRDMSTLILGTSSDPYTLDPVDTWDSATNDVLEQVVETLFSHELRDPDLPRINLLAESYHWENATTLQIKLRVGILFHDYTPFNASAAKWNLDRLLYLTNCTGTNTGEIAHTQSLWMRPDGTTPIMKEVTTVGENNITITLNGPYAPFLNTLTLINAGMVSPTFHAANATRFIDLDEDVYGTGPFIYDSFTPAVEVVFSRWDHYWRHVAYFKSLKFKIYDDVATAHDDFLENQIDVNAMLSDQNLAKYEADPQCKVYRFTEETGIPNLVYYYLSFNNKKYNVTWRKALSYAINYSYIIDDLRLGNAVKAESPISPGFGLSHNQSLISANYNITKARETMVSMGFGDMGWDDAQWITVAENSPFRSVEYFNGLPFLDNTFRINLGLALFDWFKLIGIELCENDPCDPMDPWCLSVDYEKLHLFFQGWGSDYLDPFNTFDLLFNPTSGSNIALVNDTKLNSMMNLALETTDDTARNEVYKDIQWYISKGGYFHAPLYHNKIVFVHSANLDGFSYNAMGKFQAYGIWRK